MKSSALSVISWLFLGSSYSLLRPSFFTSFHSAHHLWDTTVRRIPRSVHVVYFRPFGSTISSEPT